MPRVLIIGDSISLGYAPEVIKQLADVAQVEHKGIARSTWDGLEKLDGWLGDGKWDVIYFNFGLHDLFYSNGGKPDAPALTRKSTDKQYADNLEQLVKKLQATGAKLIWASTTPIPEGARGRVAGEEVEFNKIAEKIMKAHDVTIDDLHKYVSSDLAKYQRPKNVHFSEVGYQYLGQEAASSIRKALGAEP